MFDVETRYQETERRVQHPAATFAGITATIIVHMAAIMFLANVRFDLGYKYSADLRRKKEKPMIVAEVKPQPEQVPVVVRPAEIAAAPVKETAVKVDVPKEVEALGQKPELAAIQPPTLAEDRLAGETRGVAEPGAVPERQKWEPRQEIVQIENKIVDEKVNTLARRPIPKVDRVRTAPDVVVAVDRSKMDRITTSGVLMTNLMPSDLDKRIEGGHGTEPGERRGMGGLKQSGLQGEIKPPSAPDVPMFTRGTGTNTFKAIEKYLKADLTVYTSMFEQEYGYFKIEISRIGEELLPVIPKDVILVQDCSASMAEQRLRFCRDGLTNCLNELGPGDRFNVVSFRDGTDMCFQQWADYNRENIVKAKHYITNLVAGGNTDIYGSLKDLLRTQPTPGRPVIALVVSDGYSTAGIIDSSDIIGEFSKLNNGAMSVFSQGTLQVANMYLLDLLSYCNRGEAFEVTSGRWGIPESIHKLMKQVKRPVLSDVRFTFAGGARCEVYPVLTSNLYLDKPLVLFGRYSRDLKNVVFQAIGKADKVDCDMVFDLDIAKVGKSGDKEIRTSWAQQKVYYLMGQYARTGDFSDITQLKETAKAYKIKVPYAREIPK